MAESLSLAHSQILTARPHRNQPFRDAISVWAEQACEITKEAF